MSKLAFCGYAVFVMALLLCGVVFSEDIQLPVQNHQAAIDIANRVSGFGKLPNFSEIAITVQKTVVSEDSTFLQRWIEGRIFWKVSYSGAVVEVYGERNPYMNAFDVWVDVETGRVPKIASQWMPGINVKYRLTEAKDAAHIRSRVASSLDDQRLMKLYRVPERYPKISFLECLKPFREGAHRKNYEPHEKRIVAVYMWEEDFRDEGKVTVPTWYLTGYGGNSFVLSIPEASEHPIEPPPDDTHIRTRMRIDAETGEPMGRSGN